jgi:hypothetical protein
LGTEYEERPEDPKDQICDKTQRREINVKFAVVGADGEDFEHGEHGYAKNINRSHVEIMAFVDLAKFANFLGVDVLFA